MYLPPVFAAGLPVMWDVFVVFLRLGLTSFGGPVAHLAYFRRECVERRRWLDAQAYGSVVALCQFLPGPASSQVGMVLGLMRAGFGGALAAFIGFTLPSAILMTGFAFALGSLGDIARAPWVHGLKIAAAAIVAQAVWSMARSLAPDLPRALFAVLACAAALLLAGPWTQIAVIAAGAGLGAALLHPGAAPASPLRLPVPRFAAVACLVLFAVLLAILPLAAPLGHGWAQAAAFYRSGALVFGGGHVVLPLLQRAVADPGWVDRTAFLAGYGAAQAMPGPLFSFAAFLGAAMKSAPNGLAGASLALGMIYLPSFLLVFGAAPLWNAAQHRATLRAAVLGANAAVVGLLGAALVTPVLASALLSPADAVAALALFALLLWRAVPPILVVAAAVIYAVAAAAL